MDLLPNEINGNSLLDFLLQNEDSFEFVLQYGAEAKKSFAEAVLAFVMNAREEDGKALPFEEQALALRTLRTLLREKISVENLQSAEAIKFYLEVLQEEGDASSGYQVCFNALRCLTNAMYNNPFGRECFIKAGGVGAFHNLLKLPRTPTVLYFVIRNLYFVLGNHQSEVPGIISDGFISTIIATLAWCVRSKDPDFPQGEHKAELTVECMRMLFLLRSFEPDNPPLEFVKDDENVLTQSCEAVQNETEIVDASLKLSDIQISNSEELRNKTTVTFFNYLLADLVCEILLSLPSENGSRNIRSLKLEAMNMLMYLPASTFHKFNDSGAVDQIVMFLEQQIDKYADDIKTDHTIQITPILVALTNLATPNICLRKRIKEMIFPLEADKIWQEKRRKEEELGADDEGDDPVQASDKKMHPVDAPKGSLRAKIIGLLTAIESTTKRYSGELLYTLCNNESEEFVLRTGFGNAVVMLQSKGLVDLQHLMAANKN